MQPAHYLHELLCACAPDNGFAQDALEAAVLSNRVKLTGYPTHDVFVLMGQYDRLIEAYRAEVAANEAVLMQTYADAGLLEELNRAQPLAA